MEITWFCPIKQLLFRDRPEIISLPEGKWAQPLGSEERGWLHSPGLASSSAVRTLLHICYFSVTITVMVSTETESAQRRKDRFHLTLFCRTVFSQQRRKELVTILHPLSACAAIQARPWGLESCEPLLNKICSRFSSELAHLRADKALSSRDDQMLIIYRPHRCNLRGGGCWKNEIQAIYAIRQVEWQGLVYFHSQGLSAYTAWWAIHVPIN